MTTFRKTIFNFPSSNLELEKIGILKALRDQQRNLEAILDRGIIFDENFDSVSVTFTSSATPDNENTIPHGLGKIPIGWLVYSKDKAGDVYDGTTAWTTTNLFLKVDIASVTVKIIIF